MDKVDFNNALTNFPNLQQFWGVHEYEDDHYKILIEREKNRLYFCYTSSQIEYRATLVEWMKKIATLKKLENNSVHLAVYLLDIFMDSHDIVVERLHLIALVCLLLATKFEEYDMKCLKPEDFNKILKNRFPLSIYFKLEIEVLKYLNWNLFLPTAVQFVNYYIGYLLTEEDVRFSKSENYSDLWHKGKTIIHSYLDCVIVDVELMQRKPSLVAASIIATTRLELGLATIWPTQIIIITGFRLFDLKCTVSRLRKVKNKLLQNLFLKKDYRLDLEICKKDLYE